MKQIFILLLVTISAQVQAATMADFSGVWKMTERYCLPDMTNTIGDEVGYFTHDGASGKMISSGTYSSDGTLCSYTESGDFAIEGADVVVYKNITHQFVCNGQIENAPMTPEFKFSFEFLTPTKKKLSTKQSGICPAGGELVVIEERI